MIRALRLAVVALAIALTGCIRYEEHVTFLPAGSGTFELQFGFDMTLFKTLDQMSAQPTQPQVDTSGFAERLGEGLEMESLAEEIGGRSYEGFRLKIDFESPDAFEELIRNVAEGAGQRGDPGEDGTGRMATELKLEVVGSSYTLTGVIPTLLDDELRGDPFARSIFGTAKRSFRLSVPGRITASNADSQEGQTLAWTLDPLSTSDRQINASWTVSP
jgi:hypothetical protein